MEKLTSDFLIKLSIECDICKTCLSCRKDPGYITMNCTMCKRCKQCTNSKKIQNGVKNGVKNEIINYVLSDIKEGKIIFPYIFDVSKSHLTGEDIMSIFEEVLHDLNKNSSEKLYVQGWSPYFIIDKRKPVCECCGTCICFFGKI
jgi:hypothetical protein